jgi:DNA-binding transcriptional LysR family regulator
LTLTERPVDLVADGYDLGLVLPFMLSSDTTVTRLLERMPFIIVATPEYLDRRSRPTHPSELAGHQFVVISPAYRKPQLTFRLDAEEVIVPLRYDIASNNAVFNREMVLQGFGIGVAPAALVQCELAEGRLVALLEEFALIDAVVELRLAYNTRTLLPAKVKAFVEHAAAFFAEVLSEQPSPDPKCK